jgi:hypothetical protein
MVVGAAADREVTAAAPSEPAGAAVAGAALVAAPLVDVSTTVPGAGAVVSAAATGVACCAGFGAAFVAVFFAAFAAAATFHSSPCLS